MYRYSLLRTVLDPILVVAGNDGLIRLEFLPRAYQYHTHAHAVVRGIDPEADVRERPESFARLRNELAGYFTGEQTAFTEALDLRGTVFQLKVWRKLLSIPYGKLRSYAQIARAIRKPLASRAVGQAAGQNPIPILVPCHRVVGSDGRLVGFASGLSTKARLLRLEGHTLGGETKLSEPQLF